jgi:hypothetical protein
MQVKQGARDAPLVLSATLFQGQMVAKEPLRVDKYRPVPRTLPDVVQTGQKVKFESGHTADR